MDQETQQANISRVYSHIAPAILAFFRHYGEDSRFHVDDLRRWVDRRYPNCAPDSAGRIMRELRQERIIDYVVLKRSASLYLITKAPPTRAQSIS